MRSASLCRRILELLQQGPTVGQLADRLPVGRPAVSKHLRVLSNAGLIEHRSVGTRNLYALVPGGLAIAQQWLARTWDSVLAAYAGEVSRAAGQGARRQQGADPGAKPRTPERRSERERYPADPA